MWMEARCMELALEGERLCKLGNYEEGKKFLEAAVDAGTDDPETLSALYCQLGNTHFFLGNYNKSFEYHTLDLNHNRNMGDRAGEARASGNLGNTLKLLGKYEEAFACCQRYLDITRELDDKVGEVKALYNLGNVFHAKGKQIGRANHKDPGEYPLEAQEALETAIRYYEENIRLARFVNDRASLGRTCGNLGNVHYLLGNFQQAITCHNERLSIAREFGDKSSERRACNNLGNEYMFLGEFSTAAKFYLKALQLARQLSDRTMEAQACYSLGNTYTFLRDYDHAIEYHIKHLRIARELEDRLGEGRAFWSLGQVYSALDRPDQAIHYATLHLQISQELDDAAGIALAQVNLSELKERLNSNIYFKRTNSCREKVEKDEDTLSSGSRSKRRSMENLELVKLTPDKIKKEFLEHFNYSNQKLNEHKSKKPMGTKGPSVDLDDDSFFELLSRFQSRRIDDQRCSSSILSTTSTFPQSCNSLPNYAHSGTSTEDKENRRYEDNMEDDFFDLIAGIQGSRMNDQRVDLDGICRSQSVPHRRRNNDQTKTGAPSLERSNTQGRSVNSLPVASYNKPAAHISGVSSTRDRCVPQKMVTAPDIVTTSEISSDDQFFEMLIRCQGARIDNQRSELPDQRRSAPTVPDEDFLNLIQRFQGSRLEEQRSQLPSRPSLQMQQINMHPERDK